MSNFDGLTEKANILAQIGDLAGGRVLSSAPDDASVPVDEVGKVRPYIVASFGVPFAGKKNERAFGDGERRRPYIFTMVMGAFAGDEGSCDALFAAITDRLVDFEPNGDNATALSIPYAYNSNASATPTRPSIVGRIAAMQTTINLSPTD